MRLPRDWLRRRAAAFARDGYRCVECGSRWRLECDHIVPRAEGGTHDLANLRTICRDCHIGLTRAQNTALPVDGQRDWERLMAKPHRARRRDLGAW